jgi:hypothetical protein
MTEAVDDPLAEPGERPGARPSSRPPAWVFLVLALVAVRVVAIVLLLGSGVEDEHSILGGDARRYEVILDSDGTPYRDFDVEYPPITLALIHLLGGGDGVVRDVSFDDNLEMLTRLAVLQLGFELGTAALLAWAWNRRTAVAYLVLGTPFIFFPFPYARIDLFTVFLAVLALALVRKRFDRLGGAGLAVATLAKLWPLVVAPLLLVLRRPRALGAWLITLAAGVLGWLLLFGPSGLSQVATFRGSKGWQIESFVGIFFHMADQGASRVEQGAWRTGVTVPLVVKYLLPVLALATTALAWWWTWLRRTHDEAQDEWATWATAPLASVLGSLVFSTIISPQYILWFAPFVAVLAARGERLLSGLYLVVAVLTTFIIGSIHGQIQGELYATLPIVVRNGLLVAMLAIAMWRLSPWSSALAPQRQAIREG